MAASFKQQWQQLGERVARLSARERVLFLLTGIVVLVLLGGDLWLTPAQEQLESTRNRIEGSQRDLEIARLEVQGKQLRLRRDPDEQVRQQLAQEQARLHQLEANLKAQTVDLIGADEMPAVLQAMLSHGDRLRMIEMRTLAPTALLAEQQGGNLYRHEIRMVLEGSYFDVYQYLRALEALPRRFYWSQFDYRVKSWPTARVTLSIYTLGMSKEFLRG